MTSQQGQQDDDPWEVPFYKADHLGFPTCEIELCRVQARWITQGALVQGGVQLLCPTHKRVLDGEVRRFSDEMLAILRGTQWSGC